MFFTIAKILMCPLDTEDMVYIYTHAIKQIYCRKQRGTKELLDETERGE